MPPETVPSALIPPPPNPPGWEIGLSCSYMAFAYLAGSSVNTEPSSNVQQLSKVPATLPKSTYTQV